MRNWEPLELESAATATALALPDRRARMHQPLPVRLLAVSHVRLPAQAGSEPEMDRLYLKVLGFVRVPTPGELLYRADNYSLHFDLLELPPQRSSYRNLQIQVPSLADLEEKLLAAEMEYAHQRGLLPGSQSILMMDPSGNWLEISEARRVM